MGLSSSYPLLPTSQQYFVLVGQNVREIPYIIPFGHPVKSLNLQNNLIRNLPTGLLQLQTLILNDNSLNEINDEMKEALLSYESLQNLELAQNQLTKFDISIIPLETINISQNRLESLPTFSQNMQKASFDFNFIKKIDKSSKTLKSLSISLNLISEVDKSLKFDKLETLDLSMNRISSIENFSSIFPVIKSAIFSYNLLKQPPTSLSSSIVELDLSGNKITAFSEDIWHLTNLEKLDVSFNKLTELPKLPNSIKRLIANNNKIEKVEVSELPSLEFVTFSFNNLTSLPVYTDHLSKSLFCSHNHIKTISIELMVKSVEQLNLADNEITEIPIELFKLPRLSILNLVSNKITEIPDAIEQSNISSLFISQNPIKKLPKLPKSLDSLFASYCEIEDVSEIFTNCVRITKICLSGNKIKKFPLESISTFPCLQVLSLSQCDLDHFPSEFLLGKETICKVATLDLSYNGISLFPVRFSAPYLVDLDLSQNRIAAIPDISKFPLLKTIRLANNPISCHMSLLKNDDLNTLDVTNVGPAEIKVHKEIREVLTSVTSLQSPFRCMNLVESGYAQFTGQMNVNNESISVRDDFDFYLVCDGHEGSVTATTVANLLPSCFQTKHSFGIDFYESAFNFINDKLENEMQVNDGCSIVCAEISRETKEAIIAHIGDSCAITVTKDVKVKILTKPHLATVRKEFEKILKRGGRVVNKKINDKLPVSRGLGDFDIVGLNNVPEFSLVKLDIDDKFLILGSSGLFSALTNEEISKLVANCDSSWDAAYKLKNVSFERKPNENISVIVVPLNFN